MKVLITGDAGFVGRAFRRHLDGHDITGVDIVNGLDARDYFRTDDTHFDLVIHLAAVVGGRKKIEGEPLSLAVDLSIDAEMFGWALRTRPTRIIYFSSSAAYPTYLQTDTGRWNHWLTEDDINLQAVRNPDMTYGWAKLTGEMLASHARAEGLTVSVFRPFSGYGADQALDYPFPTFIARAKARQDPFQVWGTGTQARDFIHIDDIVRGAMAGMMDKVEVSNLCFGRATTFNELAAMCMKEAGYYAPIEHLEAEPVGVHFRVGDPTCMNNFYMPRIELEHGIRLAITE